MVQIAFSSFEFLTILLPLISFFFFYLFFFFFFFFCFFFFSHSNIYYSRAIGLFDFNLHSNIFLYFPLTCISCTLLYRILFHSVALNFRLFHSSLLYSIPLQSVVFYSTPVCCILFHSSLLYSIPLHSNIVAPPIPPLYFILRFSFYCPLLFSFPSSSSSSSSLPYLTLFYLISSYLILSYLSLHILLFCFLLLLNRLSTFFSSHISFTSLHLFSLSLNISSASLFMFSVYLFQAISSSIFSPTSFQDVFRKSYEDLVGMDSSDDLLAIISGKTAIIVEFFFRSSYSYSYSPLPALSFSSFYGFCAFFSSPSYSSCSCPSTIRLFCIWLQFLIYEFDNLSAVVV